MSETRAKSDLLIARHRRAKLSARAGTTAIEQLGQDAALRRMGDKVNSAEAIGVGDLSLSDEDSTEKRLAHLERADRVDKLLDSLKQKAG